MILASAPAVGLGLTGAVALGYLIPSLARSAPRPTLRTVLLCTWLLHALLLAFSLAGSPPRFGFAPALSVTAWLVVAVYTVEGQFYPMLQSHWGLSVLSAVAVVLAWYFPGNPLHATASGWLPLHWALGIGSYGLFAAAVAHAWFMGWVEERIRMAADPHAGIPLLTLEKLTFRLVAAGFVLLSATLVTAFLFTESLYGQGVRWRWDHKIVFSVLSWGTFAALLAGRMLFGWRGRRAVRVLYAGAGLLFLAYVGSRFVIEVVLGRAA